MPDANTVATVLRNRREALGMSQRLLAERLETVQSHVSDLERGAHYPSWRVLDKWADALGFNVDVRLVDRGDRA